MSVLTRAIQRIFGDSAGSTEFGQIGSKAAGSAATTKDITTMQSLSQYLAGLFAITSDTGVSRLPYTEDFNSLFYLLTRQLTYLFQNGIPEWLNDADQRYYANVSFVTTNSKIYMAILGDDSSNINAQKDPETNPLWWQLVYDGVAPKLSPLTDTFITTTAADADYDVTVSAGVIADSTLTSWLETASSMTKQIDATWAQGDAAGGLFSGTLAANTTYHFFAIQEDATGDIDFGWDTSKIAANRPTGWTKYRRLRSYYTNSTPGIIDTIDYGNGVIEFTDRYAIFSNVSSAATSQTDIFTGIPEGISAMGDFIAAVHFNVNGDLSMAFGRTDQTLSTNYSGFPHIVTATAARKASIGFQLPVDSSGQIAYISTAQPTNFTLLTIGWRDMDLAQAA